MTKWLKNIQMKNNTWSEAMYSYKQNICIELENIYKEKIKSMIIEMVYKHHPMLRTKSIKGVYSEKKNVYSDSEFEKFIRDTFIQINKKNF